MYKTYSINQSEASVPLSAGKISKRVVFTGGGNADKQRATFCTNDPVTQLLIESSPLFGRAIKLEQSVEEESDKIRLSTAKPKKENPPVDPIDPKAKGYESDDANSGCAPSGDGEVKTMEEVTEINEVMDILTELGITARGLNTPEKILNKATKLGYSFPNLQL